MLNDNPLRMWGVQGYDLVAMMEKVAKYSVRVTDPSCVLFELEKASEDFVESRLVIFRLG